MDNDNDNDSDNHDGGGGGEHGGNIPVMLYASSRLVNSSTISLLL